MTDDDAHRERFGFIAQELEAVLPNVVVSSADADAGENKGTKAVLYQDLIALLTAAVQEQQKTINLLVRQMEDLRHPNSSSAPSPEN